MGQEKQFHEFERAWLFEEKVVHHPFQTDKERGKQAFYYEDSYAYSDSCHKTGSSWHCYFCKLKLSVSTQ